MKKRYFSLFLAAAISVCQIAETRQFVYAAEVFEGTGSEESVELETPTEAEKPIELETPEPTKTPEPTPEPTIVPEPTPEPTIVPEPTNVPTPIPGTGSGSENVPTPTPIPGTGSGSTTPSVVYTYKLELGAADGAEDIWPGETTTVSPMVYRYEEGEEPVEVTDVQYRFSGGLGFKIWKGETEVSQNDLQDGGTFTIERQGNGIGSLTIEAVAAGEDQGLNLCSRTMNFQKQYKISFENGSAYFGDAGCWYRTILVGGEYPEDDESLEFVVNTEELGGEYEIEWEPPTGWNALVDESVYKISGEHNNTIALDAKYLREISGVNTFHAGFSVSVKAKGQTQTSERILVDLEKTSFDIQGMENEMVLGTVTNHKDGQAACYIRNKEYRSGENLMLDIKSLKVIDQEPEAANTNVFTVNEEGNDILVIAEGYGKAKLQYTLVLPSGEERIITNEHEVVRDKFKTDLWTDTGSWEFLPGTELKLESQVWHEYYNEETKTKEWEILDPEKYTITYEMWRDEDWIWVEPDGTVKTKENCQEWEALGVDMTYTISLGEGRKYLYYDMAVLSVVNEYTHVFTKEISAVPGETIDAVDWEVKTFDLEHRDGIVEEGWDSYYFLTPEEDIGITLNAEKTGFTVNEDAIPGKRWISLRIQNAQNEERYGTVMLNILPEVCQHNFLQTAIKPAGCAEAGTRTLQCSKCHATKTETIPATGHKPGSFATVKQPTCTEAGFQQQKCTECSQVMDSKPIPATGHSFGEWKETAAPTALKQGIQARTCKICNAKETRSTDKLKPTIKLNVKKIPLQVKKSTTAVKVVSMTEGDSIKSWKSSNKKVAAVTSKGRITGKKAGTAKITVTLKSGISATVKVEVQKKAVTTKKLTVTGKSVKKNKLILKKGKRVTLTATKTPITSTEKITYKSSDKKVAKVSSKGEITAKKAGKANITVKSGKKKVVIKVAVKK